MCANTITTHNVHKFVLNFITLPIIPERLNLWVARTRHAIESKFWTMLWRKATFCEWVKIANKFWWSDSINTTQHMTMFIGIQAVVHSSPRQTDKQTNLPTNKQASKQISNWKIGNFHRYPWVVWTLHGVIDENFWLKSKHGYSYHRVRSFVFVDLGWWWCWWWWALLIFDWEISNHWSAFIPTSSLSLRIYLHVCRWNKTLGAWQTSSFINFANPPFSMVWNLKQFYYVKSCLLPFNHHHSSDSGRNLLFLFCKSNGIKILRVKHTFV